MNGIGGLCGWVIVLIQYPILLMNGFILLLLLPALVCAALVWAVVGLGFLCWNRILPISVKTTGPRRYRRLHPTKIVYMVYYRTTNGSGYQWRDEGGTARVLAEQLYQRGSVERRVLSIPSEDTYITVEPHLTAQQYTDGLRRRQYILLGLSGGYVLCYGVAWIVIRRKEAEEDRH